MKFSAITIALAATLPALTEALIYNKTQAYKPGNLKKYACMDTYHFNKMVPKCLHQCQKSANSRDGCAYDDLACHCANYDVYSPLVEQCAFPPQLGGSGTCTLAELGQIRPIVQDMCNFFNATLYTAYTRCGQRLSPEKTFSVIRGQTITITDIDA